LVFFAGITMEGINQNTVMYDLMLSHAWAPVAMTKQPMDPVQWGEYDPTVTAGPVVIAETAVEEWFLGYAAARYGQAAVGTGAIDAWQGLLKSVYSAPPGYNDSYSGCPAGTYVPHPPVFNGSTDSQLVFNGSTDSQLVATTTRNSTRHLPQAPIIPHHPHAPGKMEICQPVCLCTR
jgi:hypothetical protein